MDFDQKNLKEIGALIREKRGTRPQSWLAKILDTKISAISNIENGHRPVPKVKVNRLAKVLGIETEQLIPTRRMVEELKGLSVAFRGVDTLPKEALEELTKQYRRIRDEYESKQKPAKKESPAEVAQRTLERCAITKPPVDLEKIRSKWNIDVSYTDKIDFPGYVFQEKKGKFYGIGVKKEMSMGRTRFTLAHECGHIFLGHLTGNARQDCTEVGMAKNELERGADEFAKCLLMPDAWIKDSVAEGIKGIETVITISSLFKVSRQAAALRLVELSEQRCAVVFSEDGKIKWGVASPRLGAWINRGTKLARGSQAHKMLSDPLVAVKPAKTKASYWFEEHHSGRFLEHSTDVYKGTSLLTLIWEP